MSMATPIKLLNVFCHLERLGPTYGDGVAHFSMNLTAAITRQVSWVRNHGQRSIHPSGAMNIAPPVTSAAAPARPTTARLTDPRRGSSGRAGAAYRWFSAQAATTRNGATK